LRRALAESPDEQERAEIAGELGRYEIAAMQFDAAEQHLRAALEASASAATRADAASALGRCAVVSGGHGAEIAFEALQALARELRQADPERSLELSAAQLTVASTVPALRRGLATELQRLREQAEGSPSFEAVARIHGAIEHLFQGQPASQAVAEVQAAFATGLPTAARINAGFIGLTALRLAEQYEPAVRLLDQALEHAREE